MRVADKGYFKRSPYSDFDKIVYIRSTIDSRKLVKYQAGQQGLSLCPDGRKLTVSAVEQVFEILLLRLRNVPVADGSMILCSAYLMNVLP